MQRAKHRFTFLTSLLFLGSAAAPAVADCDAGKPNSRPTAQYAIDGGVAHDTRTQLSWQRCSVGQAWKEGEGCAGVAKTFTSAEAFAQAADGWRLPTQEELDSLISASCSKPAINEDVFPQMNPSALGYWSNTIDRTERVWYVNFANGTYHRYKGSLLRMAVRLVRDTPPR